MRTDETQKISIFIYRFINRKIHSDIICILYCDLNN